MNIDRLTAVEIKVNRKRSIRLLIILALIAWGLYLVFEGNFVLAHQNEVVSTNDSILDRIGVDKSEPGLTQ